MKFIIRMRELKEDKTYTTKVYDLPYSCGLYNEVYPSADFVIIRREFLFNILAPYFLHHINHAFI